MALSVNGVRNDRENAKKYFPVQRGSETLMFIAQPLWSLDEFDELCPHPEPGPESVVFTAKGKKVNLSCPTYRAAVAEYSRQRWGYTILKSLEPSNLDFGGSITLGDPTTWAKVEDVLRQELSHFEFANVMALVDEVNSLDADKLAANLATFFTNQKEPEAGTDQNQSQSAEPANS